jgi:hypothetical protein
MSPESGSNTSQTAGTGGETHTAETHSHKGCWCCDVNDAMNRFTRELGPSEEVRSHFRQGRVEILKGIRRMIDEKIERLSKAETQGTHVNIE